MKNTVFPSLIPAGASACAIEVHGGTGGVDIGDTDTKLEVPDFLATTGQPSAGMNKAQPLTADSVRG